VKKKKKIANKKAKSDRRVAAPTPRAVIICASEIEPKHIEYLWPERIGIGHTTTYYGMPEQGKSSQALDVAARVSRGATWPNSDVKAPLGSTLVVAQEDAADEVILWRYKAMGGDVSKLHIFKGIEIPDEKHLEWLDMTRHLHLIDELIRKNQDLKLIIIDPISAYFGTSPSNVGFYSIRGLYTTIMAVCFEKGGKDAEIDAISEEKLWTASNRFGFRNHTDGTRRNKQRQAGIRTGASIGICPRSPCRRGNTAWTTSEKARTSEAIPERDAGRWASTAEGGQAGSRLPEYWREDTAKSSEGFEAHESHTQDRQA